MAEKKNKLLSNSHLNLFQSSKLNRIFFFFFLVTKYLWGQCSGVQIPTLGLSRRLSGYLGKGLYGPRVTEKACTHMWSPCALLGLFCRVVFLSRLNRWTAGLLGWSSGLRTYGACDIALVQAGLPLVLGALAISLCLQWSCLQIPSQLALGTPHSNPQSARGQSASTTVTPC